MLRNIIMGAAICLFAGAVVAVLLHPETVGLLAISAVFLLGTVLERVGYGRATAGPPEEPGWQETSERFIDPETGRLVSVWFDAASGQRRYVDEGRPTQSPRAAD